MANLLHFDDSDKLDSNFVSFKCVWKLKKLMLYTYILLFLQEMLLWEDFFRNWLSRSPLKNVWELGVMQPMLSSKGLAAHTQRSLIFIKWFLLFCYCYELLLLFFIIEKNFNSHTLTGVGFFNPPSRENNVKKLQEKR